MTRDPGNEFWLGVIGGVAVHLALAGGLAAATRFGWGQDDDDEKKDTIEIAIVEPPPPLPPPEVPAPPPPEPPPPAEVVPPPPPPDAPPPPRKIAKAPPVAAPPAEPPPPEAPPPAPGPPSDDGPAEPYTYKLDSGGPGGTLAVESGAAPTGRAGGQKGGKGTGTGGGGPPDSTGSGPPPATIASVKTLPVPDGDFDHSGDYPEAARAAGIEGQIRVSILVTEEGRPSEVKLVGKGLGYGLDERALAYARQIRFKPARDSEGRAVPYRITWTFTFTVPE